MGLVLFGAAFLADHYTGSGSTAVALALLVLPLALLVWYVLAMRKAAKQWW